MTAPPNDTTTDLHTVIATLRAERDAALSEKVALAESLAARTAELVTRRNDFDERIAHQSANIDVLRAMSASPSDPQPVFNLIVSSARDLCGCAAAAIAEFDGELVHLRSLAGAQAYGDAQIQAFRDLWPMQPTRGSMLCRAIMDRQIIHTPDIMAEPELLTGIRAAGHRSNLAVPLMRDGSAIGALAINAPEPGGFSDSQVALLQTFAEQAVIAITSAETYRALQTRTADLQESLEYQTATSDVLKVISRSTFDLQPVLSLVAETAARLCIADQAAIMLHEGGMVRLAANCGFPPEYEARVNEMGPIPFDPASATVTHRAIGERRAVHIHDVATIRAYPDEPIRLGRQRTSLGVPLLREGEPVGVILLARQRVEPFTGRQIELVSTFAAQAVIAIENARLLNEQREALEQQTAMAEVLRIIAESAGDLRPVFDAILSAVLRLSDSALGGLGTYDGELLHVETTHGLESATRTLKPEPGTMAHRVLTGGEDIVWLADIRDDDAYRAGIPARVRAADVLGARTQLMAALRKDGKAIGVINIFRTEVKPFTEAQIALVKAFADQAVIAMENARLLTEQREALERQTATAEVLQVINASPGDLAPVFDALLEKALRLCDATFGSLATYDGAYFRAVAMRGVAPGYAASLNNPLRPYPAGTGRLVAGENVVQIADITDTDDYRQGAEHVRAAADLGGMRTALFVALRKDDTLLGRITIFRREVRAFSDRQIALLENFAAQAVIAMENARLLNEQREALERQTATAEVLQVINASPGDLVPVFDAIVEKAMHLCDAAFGYMVVSDSEAGRTVATRGVPAEYANYRRRNPLRQGQPGIVARIAAGEPFVHVSDLKDDDLYRNGDPQRRAMVDLGGARSGLTVALKKGGDVVGTISLYRQEIRPFSDKQIALLQNFAAQAVIAMENARLIIETREALEQQTATAEVLQVINASPGNLAPVFDAVLEKALRLCESAFGSLHTYDGEHVFTRATRGMPPALVDLLREPVQPRPGMGFYRVIHGEDVVHVADITDDDVYRSGNLARRALADLGGARTQLLIALRRDGILLGLINVYRQEIRLFSDKQIALLESFAAQAVIAMENARLLDEVRQRQEELRVTFENMGDGVAMFDETPRLVAWNRKFQDIIDLPDGVLAERLTFAEYIRYLAERGEYGEADPDEQIRRLTENIGQYRAFERVRPDGRVIEIRHNPVADGGFVLIYADITERKRNEAELRAARDAAEAAYRDLKAAQANLIQAEKMASLGQLTAGIAHEIKNPLNFVNNFAELSVDLLGELRDAIAPAEAVLTEDQRGEVDDVVSTLTGNLEKIAAHGKRADSIVKAMLEHSRGSSAERRRVDLNALVDEALNLAYHGARAQDQSFNITLEREFSEDIAPIEVNPQDLTRVFLNLFSNGFYAANMRAKNSADTGFTPTLKVTTRDGDDAVEIRVRDNGTGIPDDIRDKLFQPFFTTKPTGEGTGLGLSITYDIVTNAHAGTITMNSKVGEYSEFAISLPRKP